jgi:hypothetical protein
MTRCRCASDASGPIRVTSSVGSPTVYSAAAATAGLDDLVALRRRDQHPRPRTADLAAVAPGPGHLSGTEQPGRVRSISGDVGRKPLALPVTCVDADTGYIAAGVSASVTSGPSTPNRTKFPPTVKTPSLRNTAKGSVTAMGQPVGGATGSKPTRCSWPVRSVSTYSSPNWSTPNELTWGGNWPIRALLWVPSRFSRTAHAVAEQ